jgi:hypothetical protein
MSSRVAGAGLALIAAALLAVSIATPVVLPAALSLFAGHPTVKDHTRKSQNVYVGLYTAQMCNNGDDSGGERGSELTCKSGDAQTGFRLAGYGELGVTGLGAISLVILALLTLQKSERRQGAAAVVRIVNVIGLAGAAALIVQGPFSEASIPFGLGMALHGAGLLGGLLASVIAVRRPPPLKLRVADRASQSVTALPAHPAAPPAFDMQALFGDDQVRPGELRPEPRGPRAGRARRTDPPAFADDPMPSSDPFSPSPGADRPLFSAAPQLRPLYDATPLQGGTGGLLPIERPVIPTRPPTPVSRAAVDADGGIPVQQQPPPSLPFGADRSKSKTLPPPSPPPRSKPMSVAPSIPAGPAPHTQVSFVPPMPDHEMSVAAVPVPIEPLAMAEPVVIPPPSPRSPTMQGAAAVPPPAPPPPSDGRPESAAPPPNTEPTMVPERATPLAAFPAPASPLHAPRAETPLAPPPPPIAAPPRPHRESQLPPPRPRRDSQVPRPALRAAVPMPAKAGRSAGTATRPPPLAIPLRGSPPRPAISASGVPSIPPIPAIPIPAIPIPAIPAFAQRAETDPDGRLDSLEPGFDPVTGSRVPIEVGDYVSQTNVSDIPIDDRDPGTSPVPLQPNDDESEDPDGPSVRVPDTSPTGEPVGGFALAPARGASPINGAATHAPEPPAAAFPVPIAIPAPTPAVRDRPMPRLPISTAPDSLPPPRDTRQQAGPSPACPQCESPMAWVEEHLRFYCKSCRMYF